MDDKQRVELAQELAILNRVRADASRRMQAGDEKASRVIEAVEGLLAKREADVPHEVRTRARSL